MGMRTWLGRYGLELLGVIAVVVGVVLFVMAPGQVTAFGWTAYTPLDQSGPDWPVAYLSGQRVSGLVVGIVGLVLFAGAIGFRLGRRGAGVSPVSR